jgi:hypothetical protein
MMLTTISTVHTIFKTHLDLGFTDFAGRVVQKYFNDYIPQAVATAETLRRLNRPERFIWTTGAWLIYHYLEQAAPPARERLEKAILAGDVVWHALPFTSHSELLDPSLFSHGLRYCQILDRRFGKKTIAAKMTDVPGHTRGIVPLLAEAGIEFLHIGVNEASTMPDLPPLFIWRDPEGAELVVMYQHTYGTLMVVPGLTEAITFGHTVDNIGPQSPEQVIRVFAELEAKFPQTQVIASTLDNFAAALRPLKPQLPVITEEIGDTWIHGAGTDPKKVSQFRELSRLRQTWLVGAPGDEQRQALDSFSDQLLLVAEHTWGLDIKHHLADPAHYRREQFERVRQQPNFRKVETSWQEQRAYLDQALAALGDLPYAVQARQQLSALAPTAPDLAGFTSVDPADRLIGTTHFEIGFDPDTGAIVCLQDKASGHNWASPGHLLAWFRYQTFNGADYRRYLDQYLVTRPEWALLDFSKPGLGQAGGVSGWWQPTLSRLYHQQNDSSHRFVLELCLSEECVRYYGGPGIISLTIQVPDEAPELRFDLQWDQKPANRQPEAFWFSFCPLLPGNGRWLMDKLGQWISPLEVIAKGNRKLHAVGQGLVYRNEPLELLLITLDAPLVAPGEPSLLDFNNEPPDLSKGMHFNLYNNVWGTNFPMWYDEAARFRFVWRLMQVKN